MTVGDDTPRPLEELCRSPWLIIYGQGPISEEIAHAVEAQCHGARIRCRVRAIDDCSSVELARYPGLVAVLPTFSEDLKIRQALEPFANLVADYRARWEEGLAGVLAGRVDPFDAGVMSLLGQRVLLHNPAMRSALRDACAIHFLDEGNAIDALRPYREASTPATYDAPWERDDDVASDVLTQTWAYLRKWRLTDPACVPELLQRIHHCRSFYENPVKSQLFRPIPALKRNRLDIILDGPDEPYGDAKTWNENGARVWRYVYSQLQAVDPKIMRPGLPTARNAQKDLRRFYLSLKIIDAWLRTSRGDTSNLSA